MTTPAPRQPSVVELVTAQVVDQFRAAAVQHFEAAAQSAVDEVAHRAEQQIGDFLSGLVPAPTPTEDAKERAGRTAVQGVISTVVVGILLAVVGVIGSGTFDFGDASDWRAVGGAALGAVAATITAYIHRLVSPPKG